MFNSDGVQASNSMSFLVSQGVDAPPPLAQNFSGNAYSQPSGWINIGHTEKVDSWSLEQVGSSASAGSTNRLDDLENVYTNYTFTVGSLQFDRESLLVVLSDSTPRSDLGAVSIKSSHDLFKSCIVRFHTPSMTYGYYFRRVKLTPSSSIDVIFNDLSIIGFDGFVQEPFGNPSDEMLFYPPTSY